MEIKRMKLSDIKPALYNPRKDLKPGDPEYDKMRRSIDEFDCVEPLVWNKRTKRLVGGHQRLKILEEKGVKEFEVSIVDLDERREKALNVALNKIQGDWDFTKLADLITELDDGEFDLELTGFDMSEIEQLMEWTPKEEEPFDAAAEADKIKEPKSKRGEIYRLGRHRLMCGDATSKEDVERLMGGEKADMVFTDPPYGVGFDMKNDNKEYLNIFSIFYSIIPCNDNIYICCDYHCIGDFYKEIQKKHEIYNLIIWVKNLFGQGKLYHTKHEEIIFCGSGNFEKQNINKDENVWNADSVRNFGGSTNAKEAVGHPTQKPVEVVARAIKNSSKKNQIVYDGFGGSGLTLIACEQLNRQCRMMEIDETYCDVIIARWEKFTGEKAELIKG